MIIDNEQCVPYYICYNFYSSEVNKYFVIGNFDETISMNRILIKVKSGEFDQFSFRNSKDVMIIFNNTLTKHTITHTNLIRFD